MTVLEELTELRLQRMKISLWFATNLPEGQRKSAAVESLDAAFVFATMAIEEKTE